VKVKKKHQNKRKPAKPQSFYSRKEEEE